MGCAEEMNINNLAFDILSSTYSLKLLKLKQTVDKNLS